MLQDKYLPDYDFSEVHRIAIHQTPERIFPLVDQINLRDSWIIRLLFTLRGLTPDMQKKKGSLRESFIELEQHVDSEIILGLVGQFWKPNGNLKKLTPDEFVHFEKEGFLKATWNFKTIRQDNSITMLETETRIKCFGKKAHRKFGLYWFFIKPFSGLIRREMLRLIKKQAEQA